ncbi:MAG: ABC transporter permease, partial [Acidobacteria bacterium]|nr:ABC transporter permease [Acidobacteriota bacterium]
MAGMREDLRIAWRRLIGRPAATFAAIAALALGIGFSTANYSVADALLFHPLPIPDISRVLVVGMRSEGKPKDFRSVPAADYFQWASSARTVSAVAADRLWYSTLTGSGEPLQVTGARVTASFFDVMQIRPALGRFFDTREEAPGEDDSVLLSHRFWVRQFAADAAIVGRTIELSGRKFTVLGVLPQGFNYPRAADFLVPLALTPAARADAGSFYLKVSARLRDGASIEQAREEFSSFARAAAAQYPDSHTRVTTSVVPIRERASGDHAPGYTRIMIVAVLFLLLIACLNVANLQLARIVSRSREMAVRAALGASRFRIARQVLVEGLLLSAAGAGLGVVLASWVLDFIRASMPPEVERFLPGWRQLGINQLVLFWTVVTALAAGFFSSLAPVFWLNRIPVAGSLHEAGRASTSGLSRQRLRTGLVVFEAVLAVVLLIGAGLMVRSFQAIGSVAVAFDPEKALTFRLSLPEARYSGTAAAARFQQALIENLQALPGVRHAALVSNLPGSG